MMLAVFVNDALAWEKTIDDIADGMKVATEIANERAADEVLIRIGDSRGGYVAFERIGGEWVITGCRVGTPTYESSE